MRVISLVTEGLERAAEVGGLDWLFAQDADIICLQDTRCAEHTLRGDAFFPEHFHPYFLDHYENPSLNGVAIYCKELPKAIIWGLGFDQYDTQGLYIQADYADISIGSVLVPSGRGSAESMAHKLGFLSQLSGHLDKVRNKRRGYILCGGWELMAHHADAEDAGNSQALPVFRPQREDGYWTCTTADTPTRTRWQTRNPELTRGGLMVMMPAACAPTPRSSLNFW